jgi:hypothetical protein
MSGVDFEHCPSRKHLVDEFVCCRIYASFMVQEDDIDVRFKESRETVKMMAEESAKEAERHLRKDEVSLKLAFHEGETGSLELALDYLDDVAEKGTPLSANRIEETYVSLLLSEKRMRGNLSAMERIIRAMQATFDLPDEAQIEQDSSMPVP